MASEREREDGRRGDQSGGAQLRVAGDRVQRRRRLCRRRQRAHLRQSEDARFARGGDHPPARRPGPGLRFAPTRRGCSPSRRAASSTRAGPRSRTRSAIFSGLTDLVVQLGDRMAGFAEAMSRGAEASRRAIETIASKTNMLALNATIEAARAGEAGAQLRGRRRRGEEARPRHPRRDQRDRRHHRLADPRGRGGHHARSRPASRRAGSPRARFTRINDTVRDVADIVALVDRQTDGIAQSTSHHPGQRRQREERPLHLRRRRARQWRPAQGDPRPARPSSNCSPTRCSTGSPRRASASTTRRSSSSPSAPAARSTRHRGRASPRGEVDDRGGVRHRLCRRCRAPTRSSRRPASATSPTLMSGRSSTG